MIDSMKRITIVTGHYGSGKTNFAVNLAVDLCRKGKSVVLVDLDIVNPYFRSADFKEQLTEMGIEMICPVYANTNLDIPALGADIYSVFNKDDGRYIIFDVGGDDAGAAALGRYSHLIQQEEFEYAVRCKLLPLFDPTPPGSAGNSSGNRNNCADSCNWYRE